MKTIKVDPLYSLATERSDFLQHDDATAVLDDEEKSVVLPLNIHLVIPEAYKLGYAQDVRKKYEDLIQENPFLEGQVEVSITGLTSEPANAKNVIEVARVLQDLSLPVRTLNVGNTLLSSEVDGERVVDLLIELGVKYNINCRHEAHSLAFAGMLSSVFNYAGGSARLSIDSSQFEDDTVQSLLEDAAEYGIESVIVRSSGGSDSNLWEEFKLKCAPLYRTEGLEYEVFTAVWQDKIVKFYEDKETEYTPVVWAL